MLVTTVVLINLLIAMMSDTYQRIQASNHIIDIVLRLKMLLYSIVLRSLTLCNEACPLQFPLQQQSDVEWKFGLAKLIRYKSCLNLEPGLNGKENWV